MKTKRELIDIKSIEISRLNEKIKQLTNQKGELQKENIKLEDKINGLEDFNKHLKEIIEIHDSWKEIKELKELKEILFYANHEMSLIFKKLNIHIPANENVFEFTRKLCLSLKQDIDYWQKQYGRAMGKPRHIEKGNFIFYTDSETGKRRTWKVPKKFCYKNIWKAEKRKYAMIKIYFDEKDKNKFVNAWEYLYEFLIDNKISYIPSNKEKPPMDNLNKLVEDLGINIKISKKMRKIWDFLCENKDKWTYESELRSHFEKVISLGTINTTLNQLSKHQELLKKQKDKQQNMWKINIKEINSRYNN